MIIRKLNLGIVIFSVLTLLWVSGYSQLYIVDVEQGKVEGVLNDGVSIFKGIPYAAAPVGNLRWKAPQPPEEWNDVLKADKYAPSCPQMSFSMLSQGKQEYSEDCLYLNVWTPANSSEEKLPVLVWIHGGGFVMGSTNDPMYDGKNLAKEGAVVVSIAYRVGVLGFMAHPELSAESEKGVSGNYGILDQIAALKWIQKNIHEFGGDPERVSIFGESSGGSAVSILSASPLTKGLFFGAICESGAYFNVTKKKRSDEGTPTLKMAEKIGVEFANKMGVSSIDELRKIAPDTWNNDIYTYGEGNFQPVVDGYVITDDLYNLYNKGNYNDIHVIVGTNSDEGATFSFMNQVKLADYKSTIEETYGPFADRFMELYPGNTEEQVKYSLSDINRDKGYAWHAWTWARFQKKTGKANVYLYYFDQQQEASGIVPIIPRGAGHGAEIPYVFKNLDNEKKSEEDLKLSHQMAQYWINFAKTGNPNGEGLANWPRFNEESESVMYLHSGPETGKIPNLDKLILMEEYFKWKRD